MSFPAAVLHSAADDGARYVFDITVDRIRTACGYGVPRMGFEGDRPLMDSWAEDKGAGLAACRQEHDVISIDGSWTGLHD